MRCSCASVLLLIFLAIPVTALAQDESGTGYAALFQLHSDLRFRSSVLTDPRSLINDLAHDSVKDWLSLTRAERDSFTELVEDWRNAQRGLDLEVSGRDYELYMRRMAETSLRYKERVRKQLGDAKYEILSQRLVRHDIKRAGVFPLFLRNREYANALAISATERANLLKTASRLRGEVASRVATLQESTVEAWLSGLPISVRSAIEERWKRWLIARGQSERLVWALRAPLTGQTRGGEDNFVTHLRALASVPVFIVTPTGDTESLELSSSLERGLAERLYRVLASEDVRNALGITSSQMTVLDEAHEEHRARLKKQRRELQTLHADVVQAEKLFDKESASICSEFIELVSTAILTKEQAVAFSTETRQRKVTAFGPVSAIVSRGIGHKLDDESVDSILSSAQKAATDFREQSLAIEKRVEAEFIRQLDEDSRRRFSRLAATPLSSDVGNAQLLQENLERLLGRDGE